MSLPNWSQGGNSPQKVGEIATGGVGGYPFGCFALTLLLTAGGLLAATRLEMHRK
jgi:hypothetical protein